MDETDRQLICALQNDARISITELSKTLHLSRTSTRERILKLVENGVIERFTVHLSLKSAGKNVLFLLMISNLKKPVNALLDYLSDNENILEVHILTGGTDVFAKLISNDIDSTYVFLKELNVYGTVVTSTVLNSPLTYRHIKL